MAKKRTYDTSASTPEEAYDLHLDTVKDPVEQFIARCEKAFKSQMTNLYATVDVSIEEGTEEGVIAEVTRVYQSKGWTVTQDNKVLKLKRYVQTYSSRD